MAIKIGKLKIKFKNPFRKGGAGDTSPPVSADPSRIPDFIPIVGGKKMPSIPKK